MKTKKIIESVLFWATNILVLAVGIYAITVALVIDAEEFNELLIGLTMLIGGVGKITNYLFSKKLNKENALLFVFGLLSIGFGFVFIFGSLDMNTICIIWGFFEIFESSTEIALIFLEEEKKLEFYIEILLSLAGMTFGILLACHGQEGLTEHLIFMGIIFFINLLIPVFNRVKNIVKSKKQIEE